MSDEYRIGTVHSVNEKKRTVRVKYEQFDNMISAELKVVWQEVKWMPRINEDVLCICPQGGDGDGFVIGRV